MPKLHKNTKGFSVLEAILIIVIVAVIGFVGWYVYSTNKKSNDTFSSARQVNSSSPAFKNNKKTSGAATTAQQQSPQSFVNAVLASLSSNNQTNLEQYLTPTYKTFRQTSLAAAPCGGKTITNPLILVCGSLLDPTVVSKLTPAVSDFTFKDGQTGKSVDYQIVQTSGDAGTTYFTFKLLSSGTSWQLNDYADGFVGSGSTVPSPLPGERESSR